MPLVPRTVNIGPSWLYRREIGMKNPLGTNNKISRQLYTALHNTRYWKDDQCKYGGIFGLEFSPDGSLLVAACEKRNVLVMDPLLLNPVFSIDNAHDDCVNCVKFVDDLTFATGSDDCTVALWDVRNMNQKLRSLQGHDNWVKSIEYSKESKLLVTSGFDGNVLTWDIHNYEANGNTHSKIFSMNGLMRTQLTPDGKKLLICTTAGYIIVVHNLDLNTLQSDLDSFKPNMYRLMQLSQTILPGAGEYTHMFRGPNKSNRVDFICDFPEGDDAEVISSIQPHPDGHSVVSRNVSNDEKTEWTCVHNIEERLSSDDSGGEEESEQVRWPAVLTAFSTQPSFVIRNRSQRQSPRENDDSDELPDLSVAPSDVWEAVVAIQDARMRRQRDQAARDLNALNALFFESEGSPGLRSSRVIPPHLLNRNASSQSSVGAAEEMTNRNNEPSPSTSNSGEPSSYSLHNTSSISQSAQNSYPVSNVFPTSNRLSSRPEDSSPSTSSSATSARFSGSTSANSRIWTLRRTNRAVSPASSSSSSSTGHSAGQISVPQIGEEAEGGRSEVEGGAGTSRPSVQSPPGERRQRSPGMRQRRSKVMLARRRLRTNYEMNETARIQSLRQRAMRFRKRWRVPPRQASAGPRPDRVIFMSIFRETGPRGERGTSMHRHSIAALTVSSEDGQQPAAPAVPRQPATATHDLARVRVNKKVHQNIPRLTHYIEEPNLGRGFIKEICFSPDGRILCSPFGNGIRLLAFSPDVQDLSYCYPQSPVPLHEVSMRICHSNIVVSTKFSPRHFLLASGCLSGLVCIYDPFRM